MSACFIIHLSSPPFQGIIKAPTIADKYSKSAAYCDPGKRFITILATIRVRIRMKITVTMKR